MIGTEGTGVWGEERKGQERIGKEFGIRLGKERKRVWEEDRKREDNREKRG